MEANSLKNIHHPLYSLQSSSIEKVVQKSSRNNAGQRKWESAEKSACFIGRFNNEYT